MARKRDYAREYAQRQAKAKREGFTGYYGKRVRGGRAASPAAPAPSGQVLALRAGHRSYANLRRDLKGGRVAVLFQEPVGDRDPTTGKYPEVRVTAMMQNGDQRVYRLRRNQLAGDDLRGLQQAAVDGGSDVYSNPSLDVLGVSSDEDVLVDVEDDEEAA